MNMLFYYITIFFPSREVKSYRKYIETSISSGISNGLINVVDIFCFHIDLYTHIHKIDSLHMFISYFIAR